MYRRRDGLNSSKGMVMYHCVFVTIGAELRRDCLWLQPEMKVCRDVLHADAGSRDEKSMQITMSSTKTIVLTADALLCMGIN